MTEHFHFLFRFFFADSFVHQPFHFCSFFFLHNFLLDCLSPTQFHTTSLLWMASIAKESDTTIHPSNYLAKDGQLKIGKKGTKKLIKSMLYKLS